MEQKFKNGTTVLFQGEERTIIVSQKDFTNKKIRYQLEGVSGLIYEEELSAIVEDTKSSTPPAGKTEENPEGNIPATRIERLVDLYRAIVGKNPPAAQKKKPIYLLGRIADIVEPDVLIEELEKLGVSLDFASFESIEEMIEAAEPIILQ
jgi:hypothetical protein